VKDRICLARKVKVQNLAIDPPPALFSTSLAKQEILQLLGQGRATRPSTILQLLRPSLGDSKQLCSATG
jgi:hypothetical protein